MKVIIAGSRGVDSMELLNEAIGASRFEITEVVSGACPTGVDALGERWAWDNDIPVKRFPANWKAYGRAAGPFRNKLMAEYADALIAVWDGTSRGTQSMIREAKRCGLEIHIHRDVSSVLSGYHERSYP